jgi:sugar lactone lactonase YvrE
VAGGNRIDQLSCPTDVIIDKQDHSIIIADSENRRVIRWRVGQTTIVAGGNGERQQLNPHYSPTYLFVDDQQSVYVSDYENHRVMKWRRDAEERVIVARGNGKENKLNQLFHPAGVVMDRLGHPMCSITLKLRRSYAVAAIAL